MIKIIPMHRVDTVERSDFIDIWAQYFRRTVRMQMVLNALGLKEKEGPHAF